MKKTLQKLKKINKRICECEKEAATVQHLPYYRLFKQQAEQKQELEVLAAQLLQ
jgi:hypothetical protein